MWEASTSFIAPREDHIEHAAGDDFSLAFARIECHYFVNEGFFERPNQLLDGVSILRDNQIRGAIVHGRYDVICPVQNAWELHRAWPEAELAIVGDAGHSAFEPGIVHELVSTTDRFADS